MPIKNRTAAFFLPIVFSGCLFVSGCAASPQEGAGPQKNISLHEQIALLQAAVDEKARIIIELQAALAQKDAKITELKKKLSGFGVFE